MIVHARSEREARLLRDAIAKRLAECGLELNEQKTRIVYCQDDDRRGSYEQTSFDYLGYTFRPRLSKNRFGKHFLNFSPAVSGEASTRMRREMRRWGVARRSDKTLTDLALMFNTTLQGWINYYGRFYKSMLYPVFRHLNETLVRWAMRKYKRLRGHRTRARRFIADVSQTPARPVRPLALRRAPRRLDDGSPVSGDVHAGFCERRRVRLPPATHLVVMCRAESEARRALAGASGGTLELGLELKQAKTRIVQLAEGGEGFDFLGFHHRYVRGRTRRSRKITFLARWPSRQAMQHARDGIRELTARERVGARCCFAMKSESRVIA